jgi:hypothetical protein
VSAQFHSDDFAWIGLAELLASTMALLGRTTFDWSGEIDTCMQGYRNQHAPAARQVIVLRVVRRCSFVVSERIDRCPDSPSRWSWK